MLNSFSLENYSDKLVHLKRLKRVLVSNTRNEDKAWGKSYQKANLSKPSWSKHGLPYLFESFIDLVKKSHLDGYHLDIGCGNGVKTVNFAKAGLDTIGLDQSNRGFEKAKDLAKKLKVDKKCHFIKSDALKVPLKDQSAASISDILMFTHLKPSYWSEYEIELNRLLKPAGYLLLVLFSDKDKHFHGHKVSKKYSFKFDPRNSLMEGYEHYEGMYNTHFGEKEVKKLFPKSFKIIKMKEVTHPVYSHRKLWNVILQRSIES
jgi:ubiquinone/menaquinone biosynthesis C-methylase UbiE